jgi:ABC-type multidrug transport system fused ATPase/permease subunit
MVVEMLFLYCISKLIPAIQANNFKTSKANLFGSDIRVNYVILATILLAFFKSFFMYQSQKKSMKFFSARLAEVSSIFLHRTVSASMTEKNSIRSAEVQNINFNVLPNIFSVVFPRMLFLILDFYTVLGVFAMLIFLRPGLFLSAVLFFSFGTIIIFKSVARKSAKLTSNVVQYSEKSLKSFSEVFANHQELLISGILLRATSHFLSLRTSFLNSVNRINLLQNLIRYFLESYILFGIFLLITLYPSQESGEGILGGLTILVAAVFRISPALGNIWVSFSVISSSQTSFKFIKLFIKKIGLGHEALIFANEISSARILEFRGDLVIENLKFSYPNQSKPIIEGLNFTFSSGSATLIKGPNGVGKTTLLHLILGLEKPEMGRIFLKQNTKEVLLDGIFSNSGFLSQEAILFDETIFYNVALQEYNEQDLPKVKAALDLVGLSKKIESSDLGFHTIIGERGVFLSAGEKQRIGFARAIFREPKVLVLDEPTANLDSDSEEIILNAMEILKASMTIIVVSHRSMPLSYFDQVLDFKSGASN